MSVNSSLARHSLPSKVPVRLKEDAYIVPTAKAGDIVEAPIEEALLLFKRELAEPSTEGERRFLTFANQLCNDQKRSK